MILNFFKRFILILFITSFFNCSLTAQDEKINVIKISGNKINDIQKVSKKVKPYIYTSNIDLSDQELLAKKEGFIHLILPSILIVKKELSQKRDSVIQLTLQDRDLTSIELVYLDKLKQEYKCRENNELISRLNTHPTSIVIAQAALESGWGTSRFYREANNLFGIWSYNKDESRIRASEDRKSHSVYLKKFPTILKSISSYFKTLAIGASYEKFRQNRENTNNVIRLISYLNLYSESRETYVKTLKEIIKYNDLEQYDDYMLINN